MLKIGDKAPEFTLPAQDGRSISLADLKGQMVVLFFYPKDDTPGCTKEAIGFTESFTDFESLNAKILGISKDSLKEHDKFIAKHNLGVDLLSDEDSDVCERYGTWVEKSMYGKTYMGIERTTVLIDTNGDIAEIWRKVKVPGHVDAVLETVKAKA